MTAPTMSTTTERRVTAADSDRASVGIGAPCVFSLARGAFSEALAQAASVASTGKLLPILQSVLIDVTDRQLAISGSDIERWVTTRVGAVTSGTGRIALPAKRLVEIVNALPMSQVVSVAIIGARAKITSGRSKFELVGLPADEWPQMPAVAAKLTATLDGRALVAALHRVQPHVGITGKTSSHTMQELGGAYLATNGDGVTLTGSDGKTMVVAQVSHDSNVADPARSGAAVAAPFGVILPRESFASILRLFPADESLTITAGDQQCHFTGAKSTLVTRLLGGTYPANLVRKILDMPAVVTVHADRAELMAALARVALVTEYGRVNLRLEDEAIRIDADGADADRAEDLVAAARVVHQPGAARLVTVDAHKAIACLKSTPGEQVRIDVTGAESAIQMRDAASTSHHAAAALMPFRMPTAGTSPTTEDAD